MEDFEMLEFELDFVAATFMLEGFSYTESYEKAKEEINEMRNEDYGI